MFSWHVVVFVQRFVYRVFNPQDNIQTPEMPVLQHLDEYKSFRRVMCIPFCVLACYMGAAIRHNISHSTGRSPRTCSSHLFLPPVCPHQSLERSEYQYLHYIYTFIGPRKDVLQFCTIVYRWYLFCVIDATIVQILSIRALNCDILQIQGIYVAKHCAFYFYRC